MSRRTGIRTNQSAIEQHHTINVVNGETIICRNAATGEEIIGKYIKSNKAGTRILVNASGEPRWLTLSELTIERE